MSKEEEQVYTILLRQYGICNVRREVTFPDLHKKAPLRFDFGIYENNQLKFLIEYDGAPHFQQIKKFQKSKSDFHKYQEYDRIKNSYCLAHDIPLYRIPYWNLTNIHSISEILTEENHVKTKWHNDYLSPPKN